MSADSRNAVGPRGELVVSAPLDGIVQKVSAVPGQTVSASAPLLELAQVDTLWVRVPVYAGDARSIDQQQPATVRRLGDTQSAVIGDSRHGAAARRSRPRRRSTSTTPWPGAVPVPSGPANACSSTSRSRRASRGWSFRTRRSSTTSTARTWVYEDIGGNAYVRRRVEVARHAGNRVVIRRGIGPGTKVVTAGAAELFGTEFGAGH